MTPYKTKTCSRLLAVILFISNCLASQAVTFSEAGAELDPVKAYAPIMYAPAPSICPVCGSSDIDTSLDPAVCNECGHPMDSSLGGNVPLDGGEWFALLLLAGTCGYYHTKTKTLNR